MTVIIIRGPLGIGKSTVCKKLAKKLNAVYISVDDMLAEKKLDVVSEEEGCIPLANFIKANELSFSIIDVAIKEGKNIIIDGNFYHKEALEHMKNHFDSVFVFTLKAPVEVCIERDAMRTPPHGRWAAIAVHNLVSAFDYGVTIDVNHLFADDIVKKILLLIQK